MRHVGNPCGVLSIRVLSRAIPVPLTEHEFEGTPLFMPEFSGL